MAKVTKLDTGSDAQVNILQDKLVEVLEEGARNLSVAQIVGVLEVIKFNLINSAE